MNCMDSQVDARACVCVYVFVSMCVHKPTHIHLSTLQKCVFVCVHRIVAPLLLDCAQVPSVPWVFLNL